MTSTPIGFTSLVAALALGVWGIGAVDVTHEVAFASAGTHGVAESPMLPTEMHGDPDEASNYWSQQNFQDCGLMAVATVVGLTTGNAPTEQEIVAVASSLKRSRQRPADLYTPQSQRSELGQRNRLRRPSTSPEALWRQRHRH